jgi:hypothetical protein
VIAAVGVVIVAVSGYGAWRAIGASDDPIDPTTLVIDGTMPQARQFMDAYEAITLTPEQEAIRVAALSTIPAMCCQEFSAATCCCECNLSRAVWGLSKSLIVAGAGEVEVREAAQTWFATVNPGGYNGDSCFVGGCLRSMKTDGCGGMNADELIF